MSLRPGETLNSRYRIIKQLGQGGFGAVYRAEDQSLKTICAIKENTEYWDVAQRQFEREAIMLAGLRHPNLPRVTDYFVVPAQGQYLVMDFVDGYDLQTVLDRVKKPLFEKKVLGWIDQICDALTFLHEQDPPIIHRDIKPANIRITPSGRAMLVDFGIAKQYEPGSDTTTGARAVTAGYSPVEQYGEDVTDTRADQYALGATLYALLTARRPLESVQRVTGKSFIPPTELNPSLSPQVERVISKAMRILANERYPNIRAMREELRKAAISGAPGLVRNRRREVAGSPGNPGALAPAPPSISATRQPAASIAVRYNDSSRPLTARSSAMPEWVTIPAGKFLFGEDKREIILPAFQISKFPITNQQYEYFLLANPQHPVPGNWKSREAPVGKSRHPVVMVTLQDAFAFCRWVDARLPSEQEWEKAARGERGDTYPWGEAWEDGVYCNNWDARMGATTPVDKYARGVSPYGVWDLVGNVWEWTDSEYQGPFMHVLRGGSWRVFGKFAMRLVQREMMIVGEARDDLGFRCVRSV